MKKSAIKYYIFLLVLLSSLQLIFAIRTNTFFSVDDFFEIAYFNKFSPIQFVPDFLIHGDMNEFVKITGFVFFYITQKLFGLNHFAFDGLLFVFHTGNLILLFLIVRKLTKNDFGSFFVSLIFNKNYLFYYSNIHELSLTLFSLLTIFTFIYFPKKFYLTVTFFVLALFSKETAVFVPLALMAISLFYTMDRKRILTFLSISFVFAIYAGYFFYTKKVVGDNFIYTPTARVIDLFRGLLFFVNYKVLTLVLALPLITKKYKYLPLLLVFFMALTPAAMLVNRREEYYLYMPFSYLMIYLSMFLSKISYKSAILYLIILFVFGGRNVFPKIARQNFPNWQKESIYKVLELKDKGQNDFSNINLERDAKLMLGSGTTELFLEQMRKEKND